MYCSVYTCIDQARTRIQFSGHVGSSTFSLWSPSLQRFSFYCVFTHRDGRARFFCRAEGENSHHEVDSPLNFLTKRGFSIFRHVKWRVLQVKSQTVVGFPHLENANFSTSPAGGLEKETLPCQKLTNSNYCFYSRRLASTTVNISIGFFSLYKTKFPNTPTVKKVCVCV